VNPIALAPTVGGTEGRLRILYCAFPDRASASRVGEAALAQRLAACTNAFEIDSRYHWKGAIESAQETVVLFKTSPRKVGALFEFLARHHPYEVPDIFELTASRSHRPYLEYLAETLDASRGSPAGVPRRSAGPRARGGRRPRRTRAPRRRR
jgi:periplasmic divalent cation tolerance protein